MIDAAIMSFPETPRGGRWELRVEEAQAARRQPREPGGGCHTPITAQHHDSPQTAAHGAGSRWAVRSHNQPVPMPPTAPREGRIGGMVHLHQRASNTARTAPRAAATPTAAATKRPTATTASAPPPEYLRPTIPVPTAEAAPGLHSATVDLLDEVIDT